MSSSNIHKDPKLNAQCVVILNRIDLSPCAAPETRPRRKPRVFKVHSESEAENMNDASMKKKHRKKRVKGTKRLLQLSDSEEDEHEDEKTTLNLNNPNDGSLPKKLATSPPEFVVEKSLSTPEGKRLIKSTVSSMDRRTEEISSLIHFRLCQIEEITLSSDGEEEIFSNRSNLALRVTSPANQSQEAKKETLEVDRNLSQESVGTDDDGSTVSVPSTIDTRKGRTVVEEEAESSQTIEDVDEKLRALVAANRCKPTGKSARPTSPRSNWHGWQASKTEPRKKVGKAPSLRKTLKEQQGLCGYVTSCSEAYKKNASSTTPTVEPVPVYAAASGSQKPLPGHNPRVPLSTSVKTKTTAISRGELLAADLLISGNQIKIRKKELPNTPREPSKVSTRHPSNKSRLEKQLIPKTTSTELPKSDNPFVSGDLNDSPTEHLSSSSRRQRVSRISSNESTSGQETWQHLSANGDCGKQLTARAKANLALKSGISQMKRSYDTLQGQGMKMVRVDGKSKTDVIERPFKIKTFRHI